LQRVIRFHGVGARGRGALDGDGRHVGCRDRMVIGRWVTEDGLMCSREQSECSCGGVVSTGKKFDRVRLSELLRGGAE
jgi:hypothetical protein